VPGLTYRQRRTAHLRGLGLLFDYHCAPLVLAVVTGFRGHGIWQKAFIDYFVVVATVHHHVTTRDMRRDTGRLVVENAG